MKRSGWILVFVGTIAIAVLAWVGARVWESKVTLARHRPEPPSLAAWPTEAQERILAADRTARKLWQSRRGMAELARLYQANGFSDERGHNERMSAIRQFGEVNTARFNERMSNMDREQRIRVDTIRGESQYVNPTTGERSKVEDDYNHVYTSQQHPDFFLGTDTPINPGELNWQELQKVQLKDY